MAVLYSGVGPGLSYYCDRLAGRFRFLEMGLVNRRHLRVRPMRSGSGYRSVSLSGFRFCLFGLAPTSEARFPASEVRTGFQFVVLTGVAVEENDLLRVL